MALDEKKSAVYIDTDDDITIIIEKIRGNSGNVIALVPPKRIGILQSAVNLKLIKRAADSKKKKIFIVTTDHALSLLAAVAGVAVAKNLKSDPELAALPEDSDFEDVINGEEPIIVNSSDKGMPEDKEISAAVKAINDDDEIADEDPLDEIDEKTKGAKKTKIPNFGKFRKKLFIIIGASLAAVVFLVWAFIFAPSATITINAKNESVKIDQAVFLSPNEDTDAEKYRIKVIVKEVKKTNVVEFDATGERTVGERATGKVSLSASGMLVCLPLISNGLSVGTTVTLSGNNYTTTAQANFTYDATSCSAVDVTIEAVEVGDEYNVTGGGVVSDNDEVIVDGSAAGGSKKIIKIVSPTDIDRVSAQLKEGKDNVKIKDELTQQFTDTVTVMNDSLKITTGEVKAEPAVNAEVGADGKAKASVEVTYSMMAISDDDLEKVLNSAIMSKVSDRDQRQVFDDGQKDLKILSFNQSDSNNTASIRLVTTAKIGPKIDESKIKEQAVGKKSSEISEEIKKIDGIEDVKVDLFPFWLPSVPSQDKIKIVFSVD